MDQSKSLQKPTGQLLAAMQVKLYKLYKLDTTYLVNIFVTLNDLNLKPKPKNLLRF